MTAVLSAPAPAAPVTRPTRSVPLAVHLVLAALALVVISLGSHTGLRPYSPDEGLYSTQVRQLRAGTWQAPAMPLNLDPKWRAQEKSEVFDGTIFTYTKHPLYPETLAVSTRVFGERIGLHAPQALGVLITAWCAAIMAARWNRRAGPLALWLTVASPLSVHTVVVWAHGLGAAAAAVATLMLVDVWQGRRDSRWLTVAGASLAVGSLYRSELLLFAAAAVAADLFESRRWGWRRAGRGVAMLAVPVAVALLAEQYWIESIVGSAVPNTTSRAQHTGFVFGRVAGALRSAVGPLEPRPVLMASVLVAGAALLCAVAIRRRDDAKLPLLLMFTALLALWRLGWAPNIELQGLLVAWPIAIVGLAAIPRRIASIVPLAVLAGVFTGLVLVTQYAEAGGFEWGGRFLSPLLGPLAALTAVGLLHLKLTPMAKAALVITAVVPVLSGMIMTTRFRTTEDAITSELEARAPAGLVATDLHFVSQFAWDEELSGRMLTAEPGELPELFTDLRRAGVSQVVVLTDPRRAQNEWAAERVSPIAAPEIEAHGAVLLRVELDGPS